MHFKLWKYFILTYVICMFFYCSQVDCHFSFFSLRICSAGNYFFKNGDRLARRSYTRDSMMINVGNSVPDFISESIRFCLCFLFVFAIFIGPLLCPNSHSRVQFLLRIYQRGLSPFSLVEMGIDQYTCIVKGFWGIHYKINDALIWKTVVKVSFSSHLDWPSTTAF